MPPARAGQGPASNGATVTTLTTPSAPAAGASPGGGPIGDATITWSAPSSDGGLAITAYNVYRNGEHAATVGADVSTWTDMGLEPFRDYTYSVAAVNDAGEGEWSAGSCTLASPWLSDPNVPACLGLA